MTLSLAQDQNTEVRVEGKRGFESVYVDTHSKEHSRPQHLIELQKKHSHLCRFVLFF